MKKIFLYSALLLLLNIGCDRNPIEIKEYKELSNGNYLVAFKEKFPFRTDNYKVTITDFEEEEMFYVTFDQHNIFFEIKDYNRIEQKSDTILVFSKFEPRIRIEEKRSYAFKFIKSPK